MKVIVCGGYGQLGLCLQEVAIQNPAIDWYFFDKNEMDISQADSIENQLKKINADYCINAAAYTAVDKAESDSEMAFSINAQAVETLAKLCQQYQTTLLHISTDYVFDGETESSYQENATTNPRSVY